MKRHHRLDAKGFSHHLVLMAFVLIFAVSGVGYLVAGHAQSNKPKKQSQKTVKKPAQQKKVSVKPAAPARKLDPQPATPQPISDNTPNDGTSNPAATASGFGGPGNPTPKPGLDAAIIARSQLGKGNQPAYNGPAGEWCAAFATWVWHRAGIGIPHYTNASQVHAWGVAHHKWHTTKPRVGDLMVYSTLHVGIVVSSDGTNIKAIDGNWSNRVSFHQSNQYNSGPVKADYRDFYTSGVRVSGFVSP